MSNYIKTSFCFVCLANLENNLVNKSKIAEDNDHERLKRESEVCFNFCYLSSKLIHLEESSFKSGLLPYSNDERQLRCCGHCLPRLEKFCETYENLFQILDDISNKMKDVSAAAAKECPQFTLKTLEKMDICQLQRTFIEKAKRRAIWTIPVTKLNPVANNADSMPIMKIERFIPPQEESPVELDHFLNYTQNHDTMKSEQVNEVEVSRSVEEISEAEDADEQAEISSCSNEVFDTGTVKVKARKKPALSKFKDIWKKVSITEDDLARNWRVRITHLNKSSKLTLYRCAYSRGSTPCVAKLRKRELSNTTGNGVTVEFESNSNSLDHSSHSGFINKDRKCLLCPKINTSQYELERHMRTHTKETPFHCGICGKEYTEKKSLTNHQVVTKHNHSSKRSTSKKTVVCNICGKKFATPQNLKLHMHSHSDSRNFQCDICERKFKQLHNLKFHKRQVHRSASGDKPYQCEVCGMKFDYSNNLRWHRRQYHDDEEAGARYKCPYEPCTETFCQKSWLQRHIKLHSGERPFQCDQCGYAFQEKSGLKRHLQTHLGLSPYLCRICGKVFKRRYSLKRHEQKHNVQEERG